MRRLHFGLAAAKVVDLLEIRWPSGTVQKIPKVKANQILQLTEARGTR